MACIRLASVHKCLRIRDLCKELAFGTQCASGESHNSYTSFEFSVLCRKFLESEPTLKPLNPPKKMVTIKDPVLFAILPFWDISNAGVQMAGTLRSLLRFFLGARGT